MRQSRRSSINPFYVMEVMKAAAARQISHGDVLHLEVGQPLTPAPSIAREAAMAAIEADRLGYTGATGIPELRAGIADRYRRRYGVEVDLERIVVTVGASGGFTLAMLACLDEGDRVGITEPGYAAYRNIIEALGLELVGIRVDESTGFNPTPRHLDAAGPLDAMVIASPSNPTGTVISAELMADLVDTCRERDITLISDEIYHGITFGTPESTALAHTDDVVVVQSFSKYQSMTGWRVGWLVVPPELLGPVERLAQNLFISAPAVSQHAALAALGATDELEENVARYRVNRDLMLEGLRGMGIDRLAPADGAFYVWADVGDLTEDSQELCRRWLDEIGVAATPGVDFDPGAGHRFVRFSYAESTEDVAEAIERLARWMDRHR